MTMRHGGKILLVGLLLVYTLSLVSSANVGISPASIKFEDVMRGGFAERYIVISVDSDNPVKVSFNPRGDVGDWIKLDVSEAELTRGEPYYLKVNVNPAIDAPNGNYTASIQVLTESFSGQIEEHAVGKIRSSLDLTVFISVTDVEIVDCEAKNIRITSAEEGDEALLSMSILNKGNIQLNPKILVDVWDQNQLSILLSEEFFGETLFPTIEKDFSFKIPTEELSLGQYWSEVSLPECLREVLLTFDILEEGAMSSRGVLLSILAKGQVKRGETVPFEASFKNIGEKQVSAYFKGEATLNGRVVQIFESEKLDVSIESIEKFRFFFTPQKAGKYVISGRVYYDGKKTFENSTTVDVVGGGSWLPVIYGAFFVLIGVLFYKIRKEKIRYSKRVKMLR